MFKICYEFAESDLKKIMIHCWENALIIPETFIWHVFRCVASGLAFCCNGTNSGRPLRGWETIIHGDLKEENIFLFPPDERENRFYPYAKIADFGLAVTEHEAPIVNQAWGTQGYLPPETYRRQPPEGNGSRDPGEATEPTHLSDIWTLGLIIRRMISLINCFVPEAQEAWLVENGYKRPFYSPALNRLVEWCLQEQPHMRPLARDVFQIASHFHEIHRTKLYAREEYARQENSSAFLGQVLFSQEDRRRYDEDALFKRDYLEVNNGPLRDWLGVQRDSWRSLDPEQAHIVEPATGPQAKDLQIPILDQKAADEKDNVRLILENERYRRWLEQYFDAAGALVPPPQKPEGLSPPQTPKVTVLNANWGNVPQARPQSIANASFYFRVHPYNAPVWRTADYERGDVFESFGSDDHSGSSGGDGGSGGGSGADGSSGGDGGGGQAWNNVNLEYDDEDGDEDEDEDEDNRNGGGEK